MAGRKEYELLFKLQAALGGNFNTVFQSALNTTKQMQNSLTKLNSITGKIDAYKKQEAALESNRQKLERLTAEHDKLQREISETAAPSEELRQKMAKNEKQIAATTAKIEAQEQRLQTLGSELSDAGVNTANLSAENERLAKTYDKVKKSQEELAKVSAALEQNNAAISQTKTQLAGTLGTLAALGGAIYAGPVKKAAEFEAQMSTVKAISNASADDMKRLSEEAKHMGATTQFTAVEAGKALEYHRVKTTKRAPRGESIEKRPEVINQRITFGHWEMDTVYSSKEGSCALLVMTERLTRKEIIEKMRDRTAISTVRALNRIERRFGALFPRVFQTITVDNGGEFSDVKSLEQSILRRSLS